MTSKRNVHYSCFAVDEDDNFYGSRQIDTTPYSITHLKPSTKYLGSQYYQLFFCSSSGVSLSCLRFSSSLVTWEVSSPKHTAS
ncbi:hypothetical protein PHJA_002542000 [Phtheirospermum japonicum]|uniref:Uncharacterized protein n=1 Tax=Phtheirospermum japonicum TaxID=374723 RepID=A0A830CVR6_9LAMI|nr:hypothetical protein PHJA_002542000 [Phtheirospermum japonicum]